MAKLYQANAWVNGAFSVVDHPVKGIGTKAGKVNTTYGTMDADDADKALTAIVTNAEELKRPLDRWSVYVEGENEKLPDAKVERHLPLKTLKKAIKAGWDVTIEFGKFSHPRVTLRDPEGNTKAPRTSISKVLA